MEPPTPAEMARLEALAQEEYDRAGTLGKLRYRLGHLRMSVDLSFPFLMPALLGTVVATVVMFLGAGFLPEDVYGQWWTWVSVAVGLLFMWGPAQRNLRMVEFTRRYLDEKNAAEE